MRDSRTSKPRKKKRHCSVHYTPDLNVPFLTTIPNLYTCRPSQMPCRPFAPTLPQFPRSSLCRPLQNPTVLNVPPFRIMLYRRLCRPLQMTCRPSPEYIGALYVLPSPQLPAALNKPPLPTMLYPAVGVALPRHLAAPLRGAPPQTPFCSYTPPFPRTFYDPFLPI